MHEKHFETRYSLKILLNFYFSNYSFPLPLIKSILKISSNQFWRAVLNNNKNRLVLNNHHCSVVHLSNDQSFALFRSIYQSIIDSEENADCNECDATRSPVDNWFQWDQMKVIVQSKWSNLNQFACLQMHAIWDERVVCRCGFVFSGILVVCFSHRLWLARFFSFCLSEAHCFSAQVSAITETNWQTSWKKTCTFRVNVYFFDVYSFPLNNARWNEVGWNAMVLFFLEVVFYAFHIRFVKSNQIWFFSS